MNSIFKPELKHMTDNYMSSPLQNVKLPRLD